MHQDGRCEYTTLQSDVTPAGGRRYPRRIVCRHLSSLSARQAVNNTTFRSKTVARTSFCAENIEFMMGIYDGDWSGDTEITRIRGSGRPEGSSDLSALGDVPGFVTRLISAKTSSTDRTPHHKSTLTTQCLSQRANQPNRNCELYEIL